MSTPRTIRFWTSHDDTSPEYWRNRFAISPELELVFDLNSPDYLFVTEQIYTNPDRLRKFLKLDDGSRVSIYYGGEAISPDMNLFDYACCFDRNLSCGDRVIRKPVPMFFHRHVFTPLSSPFADSSSELARKKGFCNFIYSNPCAHPRRDELFHALGTYKRVDALGPHLNNCGNVTSRESTDWRQQLVKMKRPYKFSIAAENARFNGYSTEKLISSFQAHTIPIYWGDPSVADEFNPKAFINADTLSDNELIDIVKCIDENDELWCQMVSEPAITAEQETRLREDTNRFRAFFETIFDSRPLHQKKRAPAGYWNDRYRRAIGHMSLFPGVINRIAFFAR